MADNIEQNSVLKRERSLGFASVQVCGYHNTKGINILDWLQFYVLITKEHITLDKPVAGSTD